MSDEPEPDIPQPREGETADQFFVRRMKEIEADRLKRLQQPLPPE